MNPPLLSATSPRLAELEASLGQGKVNPDRPIKHAVLLTSDGRRRPRRILTSAIELEWWFWRMIQKTNTGCWEWMGRQDDNGYGSIKVNRRRILTHRFAAFLVLGRESTYCICHHCDNPPCCNPSHLFEGTVADNDLDKRQKGRMPSFKGEKNPNAKLTWNDVILIRSSSLTLKELGRQFNITKQTVWCVKHAYRGLWLQESNSVKD